MRGRALICQVVLVLLWRLGGVDHRAACAADAPEVLLQDDFLETSANYSKPTADRFAKDKALHLVASAGKLRRLTYSKTLADMDGTLRVRLPDFAAGDGAFIGLTFWQTRDNDFYVVSMKDNGMCGVEHFVKNVWYTPAVFRPVEGLKLAPGDWVELRTVVQGAVATIYVNGKKFVAVKGHPPAKGSKIALYVSAGKKDCTAEFAALKVVEPTDPRPANADADPDKVLFKQDGATYDPGWPLPGASNGVRDGAMFFDVKAGRRSSVLFLGDGAPGFRIRAKMRIVGSEAKDNAGGGFVVLAKNTSEYISIEFHANGFVLVNYEKDGKVEDRSQGRVPAADKFHLNEWTEISVVADYLGVSAYVYGKDVLLIPLPRIPRTDPKKDYKFGLLWQADDAPCSVEFKDIVVELQGRRY